MQEIYSKIKIKGTRKRPSMVIDGDLLTSDLSYKRAVDLAVKWKPSKRMKSFIDKYLPDYKATDDFGHIAIVRKYPKSFEELALYILSDEDADYIMHVLATKSYKALRQKLMMGK